MQRFIYNGTFNLRRLHPSLQAVPGMMAGNEALYMLDRIDTGIRLFVPDSISKTSIDAIIAAHDGSPDSVVVQPVYGTDDTPLDQLADAVTNLRGYLQLASPTNIQTIAAFKIVVRLVLFILKRMGF